jgi:hypothetical protein
MFVVDIVLILSISDNPLCELMKLAFTHGLIFGKGTKQEVLFEEEKDFKQIHSHLHPRATDLFLMISIPINGIQFILIRNNITLYI